MDYPIPQVRREAPLKFAFVPLVILVATSTCGGDELTLPDEGNPASLELVSGRGQNGTVGQPLSDTLIVSVIDSKDRPVSGQAVVFALTGNAQGDVIPDTATTDDAGLARSRWVLGTTSGTQTVQARVAGFSSLTLDFSAQALPDAAANVELVSGDGQNGIVGSTLADSLVVRVVDGFGNGVPGITVDWAAVVGGSVSDASTITDANGRTGVERTLGSTSGSPKTTATVAGVGSVTFTHQAGSGSAVNLELVSGDDQQGPAGFPVGAPLVVKLVDSNDNGVPGIPVTWVIGTGGGSVIPPTGVTDANGLASTNWTLGPATGSNSLNATAAGFIVPFSATGTAAAPTQMAANSVVNQNGTAGQPAPTSPSVRVSDVNDNPVPGPGVTFTVTQGGGTVSDTGTVSVTTVATGANGIATLPMWHLGPVAGPNQLHATLVDLGGNPVPGSPVVFSATGNPGPAAKVLITTQPPPTAQSGVSFTADPVVQLADSNNNPVSTSGVNVTVSIVEAGATLSGTTTQATTNGQATFTGLSLSGAAGPYTLAFTSGGFTANSNLVNLGVGGATHLAFAVQATNVTAGAAMSPAVVVEIRDASGNVVPSTANVSLDLGSNPGADPFTTVTQAASGGVATFSAVVLQKAAAGYTLVATSPGLTSATSASFDVSPGTASSIAFTQPPSDAVAGGTITPFVRISLLDAFGNVVTTPVASVSVGLGTNPAGGTLSGTTPQSTNSGVATFNNLSIDRAGTGYTLVASSGSFNATSSPFDIQVGSGNKVAFTVQPSNTTAGTAISPAVQVQIQDGTGNVIPGATNQVTVFLGTNPSGGSISGTSQQDAVNGVATFANLRIDSAGAGFTLSASADGLISTSSAAFSIIPGPPNASTSTAMVSGTVTAGSSSTITVQAKDALGNQVTVGGATVSVVVGGANSVSSAAADNGDGTYSASYIPQTAGTDNVTITLNGSAISGSPYHTTINAGPVSGSNSIATVPGSGTAGVVVPIAVQARDQFGNPVGSGGATVTVSVSGSNTDIPPVVPNGDGTYSSSYQPTSSGTDSVAITLNGSAVIGSPFIVSVSAGAANAATSTASVPNGTAGTPTSVVVQAKDAGGNSLTTGGATVSVTVTGANSAGPTVATDILNGTYTFQYTPSAAGTDNVAITLNGSALGGSPFPSTVSAGAVSPSNSTATVPPTGTAGNPVGISVQARDASGNPVPVGGATVAVTITGANSATPAVTDADNGTYSTTYTPDVSGTDDVAITLNGASISGSPFSRSVTPATANPATSTAVITPFNATAGIPISITVQARDQFGNAVLVGTESVAVTVSGSNPATLTVTDVGDGTYTASYNPAVTGSDTITITMNGTPISGSPFVLP